MLLPTVLATIPGHRRPQERLYGWEYLLLFSILAILSNAPSYRKIHRFIETRLSQLNTPAECTGSGRRYTPRSTTPWGGWTPLQSACSGPS